MIRKYYITVFIFFICATINAQQVSTLINDPSGDDLDLYNNHIYSSDYGGDVIRKISLNGDVKIILDNHTKLGAVEVTEDGTIYATNYDQGHLIAFKEGQMKPDTIIVGMNGPSGITTDSKGRLYFNENAGSKISRYDGKALETFYEGQPLFWNTAITTGENDDIYSNNMWTGEIIRIRQNGEQSLVTELPAILDTHPDLGYMEFAASMILVLHQNNDCVYAVDPETGFYAIVAGKEREAGYKNGEMKTEAMFEDPIGIVFNPNNNLLYLTDGIEPNQRLRVVSLGDALQYLPDFSRNIINFKNITRLNDESVQINFSLSELGKVEVEVRNYLDKLVSSTSKTYNKGATSYIMDMSEYESTPHPYFLTIEANGFKKTFKVQKS